MTGEGLHSSPARDGAGPTVSDAASVAAGSNALSAADLVSATLLNGRSIKPRSVARMSALPGCESIASVAWLRARLGMSVFFDKAYEYRTKLSNAKFSKHVPYNGLRITSHVLQRVRVDRPAMTSQIARTSNQQR